MLPIPYGRQEITDADLAMVAEVLRSDYLTQGPRIKAFEAQFANYVQAAYAIGVANGTAALHLCAIALKIGPGTKVLAPAMTFVASTNCVLYQGGSVEFVDIDPQTGLIDIDAVAAKLSQAPKGTYQGVIAVDYAGQAVDLERLHALVAPYDCWILEDACHAPGGYFIDSQGEKQFCGNSRFADLAIFSFHPVKHIACGEGGMITTRHEHLYQDIVEYRTHGITKNPEKLQEQHGPWYYEMQHLGFNYRLSELHAGLGLSQLQCADERITTRRVLAAQYDQALQGLPCTLPPSVEGHAYHLYVIRTQKREALYHFLRENKVLVQVHYIPVHLQPYYRESVTGAIRLPHTEHFYAQCLSLPLYPSLQEEQRQYVIDKLEEFFS